MGRCCRVAVVRQWRGDRVEGYEVLPDAAVLGHKEWVRTSCAATVRQGCPDQVNGYYVRPDAAILGHHVWVRVTVQQLLAICAESKDRPFDWTPLSWAAEYGHEAAVRLLLDRSAGIESRQGSGRMPLSLAAENGGGYPAAAAR